MSTAAPRTGIPTVREAQSAADLDQLCAAAELVITTQYVSNGMLERKLRIGKHKAILLIEQLEQHGIVGPLVEGHFTTPREVLRLPHEAGAVVARIRGREAIGRHIGDADTFAHRLLNTGDIKQGSILGGGRVPPEHVAAVLHALADHTLNQHIVTVIIDQHALAGPDEAWPRATSLGRYLHALGDSIERAITTGETR